MLYLCDIKGEYMNKKVALILMIVSLSFLCAAAYSAEKKAGGSIFEYKKELSLTDDQEKNLHDIITRLQGYLADRAKELDGIRAELNKMIADKDDLYNIKSKLRAIAQIQADASYEDIASSRAIEKELTATQLSMWHNIQEEFRKNLQKAAVQQKGVVR